MKQEAACRLPTTMAATFGSTTAATAAKDYSRTM